MSANANAPKFYRRTYDSDYTQNVLLAGRILMALLFVYLGYVKLMSFGFTVGYFAEWDFPLPPVAAVLAVIFELGGGILLLIGWKTRWVAWALLLYVAIATGVAHRFWTYEAVQAFNQTAHFFKNVSIMGGLLCFAAVGPGRFRFDKA